MDGRQYQSSGSQPYGIHPSGSSPRGAQPQGAPTQGAQTYSTQSYGTQPSRMQPLHHAQPGVANAPVSSNAAAMEYRQYPSTAVNPAQAASTAVPRQSPAVPRQTPILQPPRPMSPARPMTTAQPTDSAASTPPARPIAPAPSAPPKTRVTLPAMQRPAAPIQTSPWSKSPGSNGGGAFRHQGPFTRQHPGNTFGPYSSQVSNAPFTGTSARTAARQQSHAGAVIAIILVMVLVLASGMAVQNVQTGMANYHTQFTGLQQSASPSESRSASTSSWNLSAEQTCANLSSAIASLEGWADSDGTTAPAELTTLNNDQSACAGDLSHLSSTDLDAISNHTIDALLAWNDDMVEFYRYRSASITYRIDGKWPGDPKELEALLDASGWFDNPTYAAQQAAKLKSGTDAVLAKIADVVADLHNREAKIAGIQADDRASEQEIWAAIDTITNEMGVTYSFEPLSVCGGGGGGNNPSTVAFFCQDGTLDYRNKIMFNTGYVLWDLGARGDPWMLDAAKHELAHRSISIACGTARPKIAGARYEAVTNAYAYQFMGVNRQRNEHHQSGLEEYAAGDTEMAIAQQIHDGTCS